MLAPPMPPAEVGLASLAGFLSRKDACPLFVTGAGISIASGIPPFRGTPDAVWEQSVMEKGTVAFFQRNPVAHWKWFLGVFGTCREAKPNPAHHALKDIEETLFEAGRSSLTVTQNVDGLHTQAGQTNLIEVHGSLTYLRCTSRNCVNGEPKGVILWDDALTARFQAEPSFGNLPRCSHCRSLLRPHVLWFDESYSGHASYGFDAVERFLDKMTVVLFAGTSFAVNITDMILAAAYQRAVPMFLIDPHGKDMDGMLTLIQAKAEQVLPGLAEKVRRDVL